MSANNGITIGAGGGTIEVDSGKTLTLKEYINDGSGTGISCNKTGAGTLFLDKSGSMDFSGTTLKVVDGTLSTWNPGGNLSSTVELGSSSGSATTGTYRFQKADGGVSTGANFVVNSGGGKIDVGADALTVSGNLTGSGAFSKVGSGTLELTGTGNTHSGTTTIEAGTLKLNRASGGNAMVSSTIAIQQGTLLLGAANQIGDTTGITMSGGTLDTGASLVDNVGQLSFSGSGVTATIRGLAAGDTGSFIFSGMDTSSGASLANSGLIFAAASGQSYDFNNGFRIKLFSTDISSTLTSNNFSTKISFEGTSQVGAISFTGGTSTYLTVAAIPEPRVYAAAAGLVLLIGWAEFKRRRGKKLGVSR